jgi:hypothetical protein
VRFFFVAAIFCVVAALAYFRADNERVMSFALGMASALACGGIYFVVRRWMRRRSQQ